MTLRRRRWLFLSVLALLCVSCAVYLKSWLWSISPDIEAGANAVAEGARAKLTKGRGEEVSTKQTSLASLVRQEDTKSSGAPGESPTPTGDAPLTVSVEELRAALDKSLVAKGFRYVGHAELMGAPGTPSTLSFIYGNDDSRTIGVAELYRVTRDAAKKAEDGQKLMEQARAGGDEEKTREAARLLVEADRQLVQEGSYVTIETATTKSLPPILVYHKGLPDWLILHDKAVELAEQHLSSPVEVREIRRHQFASCVFVCEGDAGDVVYVLPNENEVFSDAEVQETPQARTQRSQEEEEARASRIRAQWEEFLGTGFDIDTLFSLSGLRDLSQGR